MKTKALANIALLLTLLITTTLVLPSIPLGIFPVPFTLQVLVIFLIGFLLNPRDSFITVFLYIMLGCIGLPVFANGLGGIGVFMTATGGFLFAMPFAAALIAYGIAKYQHPTLWQYLLCGAMGMLLIHGIGILWWHYITQAPLLNVLASDVLFLPLDSIKVLLAAIIVRKLPQNIAK